MPQPPTRPTRILAVCAGNICRSPAAEAAIRRAAQEANLAIEVESAATGTWHVGEPPHPQSVAAAAAVGLTVGGTSRQVTRADFDDFDVIVAMDASNRADLMRLAPNQAARAKIRMFRPDGKDVPDPYHGTERDYEEMVAMVVPAAAALVDDLAESRRSS